MKILLKVKDWEMFYDHRRWVYEGEDGRKYLGPPLKNCMPGDSLFFEDEGVSGMDPYPSFSKLIHLLPGKKA